MSHLTRGAWIEITGGMKHERSKRKSHLTRGAWIEIRGNHSINHNYNMSHLTRGAWIEMSERWRLFLPDKCRTSHEVRGLKCENYERIFDKGLSHLTRGAWIEINEELLKLCAL